MSTKKQTGGHRPNKPHKKTAHPVRRSNAAAGKASTNSVGSRRNTLLLLLLLLAFLYWLFTRAEQGAGTPPAAVSVDSSSFSPATVLYVLDGSRIVVLENGSQTSVQLAGIQAAEKPHAAPEDSADTENSGFFASLFGKNRQAKDAVATGADQATILSSLLPAGSTVYLQTDAGLGSSYTADGARLCHVWTELPSNSVSLEDIRTKTAEGQLLDASESARAANLPPSSLYSDYFAKLQKRK